MRILDRKKKAAIIAAVRLFMEEETVEEIAPAEEKKAPAAAEGLGPWAVFGRAQAMSLRTLWQLRVSR
jgi:hypothetical protein